MAYSPVFSSPAYWVALATGVGATALVAREEYMKRGSRASWDGGGFAQPRSNGKFTPNTSLANDSLMHPFRWSPSNRASRWTAPSGNLYDISEKGGFSHGYYLSLFEPGAQTGTRIAEDAHHAWKLVDIAKAREKSGSRSHDPDDRAERDAFQRREAKKGQKMKRTCPSCKRENALSAYEAARGYQCSDCTRRDEGGYGEDY